MTLENMKTDERSMTQVYWDANKMDIGILYREKNGRSSQRFSRQSCFLVPLLPTPDRPTTIRIMILATPSRDPETMTASSAYTILHTTRRTLHSDVSSVKIPRCHPL